MLRSLSVGFLAVSSLAVGLLVLLCASASAENPKTQDEEQPIAVIELETKGNIRYETDIEPILKSKCFSCHSGSVKEGGASFSTHASLLAGGKRGPSVVSGKSGDSPLVKFAGKTQKPFMPPDGDDPLTPRELALIKRWIDQGAPAPEGQQPSQQVKLRPLSPSVQMVRALAMSQDGSIVAAGRANHVHLYQVSSGAYVRSMSAGESLTSDLSAPQPAHTAIVESLAFSPNGKVLASGSFQEVILWDAVTGTVRRKVAGFADRVVTLAFSPDGKLLAAGGGEPTVDGEIKIIDVESGEVIVEIKQDGHTDQVFGVCFSPQGDKLASCAADRSIKIFDVTSGRLIKAFGGHTNHVLDVGWAGDGQTLASAGADNVIKVWSYETGEPIRTIPTTSRRATTQAVAHENQVTRLLFVGDSTRFVTCGGDKTARLWDLNGKKSNLVNEFTGNEDYLYAVSVSRDGAIVAAGGEEGVARLFDSRNGEVLHVLLPPGESPNRR